jgi:hypothetical protein
MLHIVSHSVFLLIKRDIKRKASFACSILLNTPRHSTHCPRGMRSIRKTFFNVIMTSAWNIYTQFLPLFPRTHRLKLKLKISYIIKRSLLKEPLGMRQQSPPQISFVFNVTLLVEVVYVTRGLREICKVIITL